MSDSPGFLAGLVVAAAAGGHVVVVAAKWLAPMVLPSIFARPAPPPPPPAAITLPPGLAQPQPGECSGCHALRVEIEAARREITAVDKQMAVLVAISDERAKRAERTPR